MNEGSRPLWQNIRLWMGFGFFLMVMASLVWVGLNLAQWLEDEQRVPLKRILIGGERRFLQDDDIRFAVRRGLSGSFIELDVDQAHADIEALPWVHSASIRKEWPDTLRVYVVEQRPVARWHDDMLLNSLGDSFQAITPAALTQLPILFGPGGSERTALEGYRSMQGLLQGSGLQIVELSLSERFAWQVRLQNGINLNLGRTEFMSRLQRFIDVYPLLKRNKKQVNYVDLRYDTGLAVGWQQEQQNKN